MKEILDYKLEVITVVQLKREVNKCFNRNIKKNHKSKSLFENNEVKNESTVLN